ncbi:Glucosidase 2 subunit beta [Quillaja saponaria]|uniref:Glucosidase 2 subunit beta n=1 Tax=Quillaja saponaria TaxID=32244 RepID=A0AAD7QFL3_QUISA|nr:Glucosidase 2 subunit beta [Quillaja saponaria]
MKQRFGLISLALCILCISLSIRSASSSKPKDPFLGIAPQDDKYYKSLSDLMKCRDGSKEFANAQLNDDFCDCPDGTDEPGTSACPGGRFYCRNAGHVPLFLFSSRVNDGICDCCDGSDEYDGKVNCPNTCWEAGKVARDKLKKKIATYQEGVMLRKLEIEQANVALANDEAELSRLKKEENILKGIVQQLKEHKEQIEKAEEKERLQKEKEVKEKAEAEKKADLERTKDGEEEKWGDNEFGKQSDSEDKVIGIVHEDKIGVLDESAEDKVAAKDHDKLADVVEHSNVVNDDSGNEGSLVNGEKQHAEQDKEKPAAESATDLETGRKGSDVSENTVALSKEELGRLVASRWTGETPEKQNGEADLAIEKGNKGYVQQPKDTHHEDHDSYASETDDDSQRFDDEDIEDEIDEDFREEDLDESNSSYISDTDSGSESSDDTLTSNPSWLEKIQQTVRNVFQAVNLFQTPVNQSEAAQVRKDYGESSAKLSKIQSRISSLTKKLKHDFGPEKEFYSFYGRCFEGKEGKESKYVYKVCPYKQASQEEGHTTTRLGRWDKFEDSYKVMIFLNGDKCWNGPDRSLKVRLRCGLKNEIADVDEPSRCEYVALLSTAALCQEDKLKELQHKLDLMNKEQSPSHDEL